MGSGSGDTLIGLGVIGVLAIGAFWVLSSGALDNLGNADAELDDTLEDESADVSGGSGDCGQLCRDKDCDGYKKSCKTGCKYCCGSGKNSPKCKGSSDKSCKALCTAHNCVDYAANCSKGCSGCSGQGTGKSGGKSCPKCAKGTHRTTGCTCKDDNYGKTGKAQGSCMCIQQKPKYKCADFAPNSAGCCAWRGSNGGCPAGQRGVTHKGGGCDCVKASGRLARAYHARSNGRTAWRFSQA